MSIEKFFERVAKFTTIWAGSTLVTLVAFITVICWCLGGFILGFGTDYQMYINTGTTIVTFLMVFLIQRAMNKEMRAIQLKLNELIATHQGASNRLINAEGMSEQEVNALHNRYVKLAERAKAAENRKEAYSIEDDQD